MRGAAPAPTSIASDANDLTNRVRSFINEERARDVGLSQLLDEVAPPAYLFGGVVRDLALYDKHDLLNRGGDIDIVCDAQGQCANAFFKDLDAKCGVVKNKFGGFRMTTNRWEVDIWPVAETWAFRHGHSKHESVESLLETTITNWDAVLFRLNGGPLVHKPTYFKDVGSGYLDVVLPDNPNPLGMYVRLVRACIAWPVSCLSSKAITVFMEAAEQYSFQDLMSYEKHHHKRRYIEEADCQRISEWVLSQGTAACEEQGTRQSVPANASGFGWNRVWCSP